MAELNFSNDFQDNDSVIAGQRFKDLITPNKGHFVKTPTDGKASSGQVFGTEETRRNSPLGKFFSSLDLDKDDLRVGSSIFSSLSSNMADARLREQQGNLAATQAATAPFSNSDLVGAFQQGSGGGDDIGTAFEEGLLMDENRKRRDKQDELRDSLFGLVKDKLRENELLAASKRKLLKKKGK